jgi:hypothetical protein
LDLADDGAVSGAFGVFVFALGLIVWLGGAFVGFSLVSRSFIT